MLLSPFLFFSSNLATLVGGGEDFEKMRLV